MLQECWTQHCTQGRMWNNRPEVSDWLTLRLKGYQTEFKVKCVLPQSNSTQNNGETLYLILPEGDARSKC